MAVYIIAEAGVNHNGRLDLALRLCADCLMSLRQQVWMR